MIRELKRKEFHARMDRLYLARKQLLCNKSTKGTDLHVVYVMSNVAVSGGVKIILEHANRLTQAGVRVTIVSHFEKPKWYPIEANYSQVPFDLELAKGVPNCDVIVATYWDHIQACIETGIAPVVYFEQGDFHLFEYESMNNSLKKYIQTQFQLPSFIFTVSSSTAEYIQKYYNRKAKVIPNAIDPKIFSNKQDKYPATDPYLLMIGAESATFKGIQDITKAYDILTKTNKQLDLFWITPEAPSEKMKSKVSKVFVQPNQELIAKLYRGATIYVSGSHYESFSLPPLEAMACGCPVVTSGNRGVREYAFDQENALITRIADPLDTATKIEQVLGNPQLKAKLIDHGYVTANKFNWETITEELIDYYQGIATYQVKPSVDIDEWDVTLTKDHFIEQDDYTKFWKLLSYTTADLIEVPVVYKLDNAFKIARWEIVANRKDSANTEVERCYCPITPTNPFSLLNQKAYRLFYKKEYELALEQFEILYKKVNEEMEQFIYFRWIILCLFRLQRRFEAKKRLLEWEELHHLPYLSELYFLRLILPNYQADDFAKLSILRDATTYPEYLFDIKYQLNRLSTRI
ncbi:glycosyltransferase family 4 protein [Aquibacillus sediminis]|uniref:glycosyltransferase family 4 protein n=1 Tax=Aquibacillus sediminis TaxID=2574734 RepID=UPI00148688D0|nr:glycosyltransferase family 4 protein [Aquibacillus sediminis]